MQLSRALELLALGLSAISVAEATFINVNGIGRDGKGVQRRQTDDSSSTGTTTATSPPVQTTSTPEPTTATETTRTTSTTPTQPPTTSPTGSPTSSTTSPGQTTTGPTAGDSTASTTQTPPSTAATETTKEGQATVTIITTWTSTASDGSRVTVTSQTISTSTPGLANNKGGQESGMSPQTRSTVIGVVVGVGGAIILGGLALVAWRIWGRKKHREENDALMDYGSTAEKPESGGTGSINGRTPFQSTLESYHAPTQVNTAANF